MYKNKSMVKYSEKLYLFPLSGLIAKPLELLHKNGEAQETERFQNTHDF